MGSKALLVLVVLLASVLVLSAREVASKDVDEKFNKNDGDVDTNGVDEMKYGYGRRGGYYGGGWRRGWGWRGRGGYCGFGCCRYNYYGRCMRCCYFPNERVDADIDAEPRN